MQPLLILKDKYSFNTLKSFLPILLYAILLLSLLLLIILSNSSKLEFGYYDIGDNNVFINSAKDFNIILKLILLYAFIRQFLIS